VIKLPPPTISTFGRFPLVGGAHGLTGAGGGSSRALALPAIRKTCVAVMNEIFMISSRHSRQRFINIHYADCEMNWRAKKRTRQLIGFGDLYKFL
jgi:hypothetical protein